MIWLTMRNDISPGSELSGRCRVCRVLARTYASYGLIPVKSSVGSPRLAAALAARCSAVVGPSSAAAGAGGGGLMLMARLLRVPRGERTGLLRGVTNVP